MNLFEYIVDVKLLHIHPSTSHTIYIGGEI